MKFKEEKLINAEELCNNRENVINALKNRVFPFKDGFYQKEESDVTSTTRLGRSKQEKDLIG